MKKLTTILFSILLLLNLCACGKQTNIEPERINLSILQSLKTKENFAKLLNIENVEDTKQMLAYISNFYYHLPYENEAFTVSGSNTTDKGFNCLTIAEVKALVTPIVLTVDNWKEYLEPKVKTEIYTYFDEDGNEVEENYSEVNVSFKEGYYPNWYDFDLILYNKSTGFSYDYSGWFWPEQLSYEDGKYYVDFYSDELGEIKEEFNFDNYICTFANGVVYKNDVDVKYCYIDEWNDEGGKDYYPATDVNRGSGYDEAIVFVLQSDDNSDYYCVGYSGLGTYVYSDEELLEATNIDKKIDIKPVSNITLDTLKACKTKEDVAALLGVANLNTMQQNLVYMKNFYNHLPSESQKKEAVTSWSITNEGYNSLTVEDAKTLITPYIITTENWKDFVEPYMENIDSYYYDDGNEICEQITEPEIGIGYDYYYSRSDVKLSLVNNNTGYKFDFYGTWSERVSLVDGKYYVTSYGEDGEGGTVEFNIDDYTCTFADGVIYKYDLNHELLYREYVDEEKGEWIIENVDDSKFEYDEYYTIAFIQYGKTNADICRVSYSGLGGYVFVDSNIEELLVKAKES